jgi:hypothetical protein
VSASHILQAGDARREAYTKRYQTPSEHGISRVWHFGDGNRESARLEVAESILAGARDFPKSEIALTDAASKAENLPDRVPPGPGNSTAGWPAKHFSSPAAR